MDSVSDMAQLFENLAAWVETRGYVPKRITFPDGSIEVWFSFPGEHLILRYKDDRGTVPPAERTPPALLDYGPRSRTDVA